MGVRRACLYDFEQATKARRLPKHAPALPSDTLAF